MGVKTVWWFQASVAKYPRTSLIWVIMRRVLIISDRCFETTYQSHPQEFKNPKESLWGTAVAQWLRCCATNRKVAGSIPDGISGFFIDIKPFRSHYGPGVDSASNRNEYREHFLGGKGVRCVRLTTLPPTCADCREILEHQPRGTLRACPCL